MTSRTYENHLYICDKCPNVWSDGDDYNPLTGTEDMLLKTCIDCRYKGRYFFVSYVTQQKYTLTSNLGMVPHEKNNYHYELIKDKHPLELVKDFTYCSRLISWQEITEDTYYSYKDLRK